MTAWHPSTSSLLALRFAWPEKRELSWFSSVALPTPAARTRKRGTIGTTWSSTCTCTWSTASSPTRPKRTTCPSMQRPSSPERRWVSSVAGLSTRSVSIRYGDAPVSVPPSEDGGQVGRGRRGEGGVAPQPGAHRQVARVHHVPRRLPIEGHALGLGPEPPPRRRPAGGLDPVDVVAAVAGREVAAGLQGGAGHGRVGHDADPVAALQLTGDVEALDAGPDDEHVDTEVAVERGGHDAKLPGRHPFSGASTGPALAPPATRRRSAVARAPPPTLRPWPTIRWTTSLREVEDLGRRFLTLLHADVRSRDGYLIVLDHGRPHDRHARHRRLLPGRAGRERDRDRPARADHHEPVARLAATPPAQRGRHGGGDRDLDHRRRVRQHRPHQHDPTPPGVGLRLGRDHLHPRPGAVLPGHPAPGLRPPTGHVEHGRGRAVRVPAARPDLRRRLPLRADRRSRRSSASPTSTGSSTRTSAT